MTTVNTDRGTHLFRPTFSIMLALASTIALSGCIDTKKIAVSTTSKILVRGQPAVKMESDWTHASRALPGSLKTVEAFHIAYPDIGRLVAVLAEGYCQYGSGFIEDEWEVAYYDKDYDLAEEISGRATKMYVRCTNYALKMLGGKWKENIFGEFDTINEMITKAGNGKRDGLMWAGMGIASTINHNKDNMGMVAQLPTAKALLMKVVELDDKHNLEAGIKRATPHVALGMLYAGQSPKLGGKPEKAKEHFNRAMELSIDPNDPDKRVRFLLAKVFFAKQYGVIMQDREFFHKTLIEVLQTPPNIWPEQRLANEIAHRRARRYLSMEKEWF
jgi:hypothetical protein